MPGTMQETAISAKQCIPSGRRRNYVLPRASGEWLWQSCFVPTFTARAEEAGAVRRSCQFDRLLAFQPQAWRTINKRTGRYGHSSRLCPLSKLHHLTTHEEREKQDRQPRVHQAHQQAAVRPMEGPNTWGLFSLVIVRSQTEMVLKWPNKIRSFRSECLKM